MTFKDCPDYNFADDVLEDFNVQAERKFCKGQEEHGGSILTKPLLHEMKGEVIDQMFYVWAIEKKIQDIIDDIKFLRNNKNQMQTLESMLNTIILKLYNL